MIYLFISYLAPICEYTISSILDSSNTCFASNNMADCVYVVDRMASTAWITYQDPRQYVQVCITSKINYKK